MIERAWLLAALLSACGGDACPGGDLARPSVPPTYAVVSSDRTSTAIALLDTDGLLLTEAWLDSGTVAPGIVAALSGDVSLPSAPFAPCTIVLIDRFTTDVVTFLDPCDETPMRAQVDVGAAFSSNPRDVRAVGGRTWVTRHSVNLAVDAADRERGNDIVIIDTGRIAVRIDLSIGDAGDEVFARPDRMARLTSGDVTRIVIGLARLSNDFMVTAPGAVALVDPDTLAVTLHPLDGLRNCGEVDEVDNTAVVTCSGPPFVSDEEGRRADAGIVALTLGPDGTLTEVAAWRAAEHPDDPVPSGPTIPLAPDRWVSVARGEDGTDTLDRLRFFGRDPGLLFKAEPFTIGDGVYDPDHDLLLVPDAQRGVIRRFRAGGEELDDVETAGCRGLEPREVRRIAFP